MATDPHAASNACLRVSQLACNICTMRVHLLYVGRACAVTGGRHFRLHNGVDQQTRHSDGSFGQIMLRKCTLEAQIRSAYSNAYMYSITSYASTIQRMACSTCLRACKTKRRKATKETHLSTYARATCRLQILQAHTPDTDMQARILLLSSCSYESLCVCPYVCALWT